MKDALDAASVAHMDQIRAHARTGFLIWSLAGQIDRLLEVLGNPLDPLPGVTPDLDQPTRALILCLATVGLFEAMKSSGLFPEEQATS